MPKSKKADTLSEHYRNKKKRKKLILFTLSFSGQKRDVRWLLMTEWGQGDTRQLSHKERRKRADKAKILACFPNFFFMFFAGSEGVEFRTFFQ